VSPGSGPQSIGLPIDRSKKGRKVRGEVLSVRIDGDGVSESSLLRASPACEESAAFSEVAGVGDDLCAGFSRQSRALVAAAVVDNEYRKTLLSNGGHDLSNA